VSPPVLGHGDRGTVAKLLRMGIGNSSRLAVCTSLIEEASSGGMTMLFSDCATPGGRRVDAH